MATSKTLTPTNVTIQIPEFTDQPDQRVNSNCIDKEADAINALNSKTTDKWDEVVMNSATVSAAAGWVSIAGLTSNDTPVCIGYCSNSSYRFGAFSFYGAWYLSVFTNAGAIPATGTNIGNIRVRYYKG